VSKVKGQKSKLDTGIHPAPLFPNINSGNSKTVAPTKVIKLTQSLKSGAGFTLIEILVVLFGFSLIAWGAIGLYSNIFTSSSQQNALLGDADLARKLVFQIASELRNGQTGGNGAYVLDTAATSTIIFYSPNADTDSVVERVRYYVKSGKLYKGVTQYSGGTYNTSTEATNMVMDNLANGANPVFYYYDGSYTGSSTQTSLSQPINVTQVKFVQINLQIYNKGGVKNTNTYSVTASAAIRNLKTNLGQ
jgi:type II secretory pathway component PulJ